jgi:23S rRNA (uracil1939-C5)-methyltransferase
MSSSRKVYGTLIEKLEIVETAAEGVCIGRHDGKVVFVPFTVPGDVADVMLVRSKKKYSEGFVRELHRKGESRVEPKCKHFTLCGGCKWQHMSYEAQLSMKQKQVSDNLERIGGVEVEKINAINPSPEQLHYRNKLEFSFTDRRWLPDNEQKTEDTDYRGLGFHLPGRFDKIFSVETCYLQGEYINEIRNTPLSIAREQNLEFYNRHDHSGFLRNLMTRNSSAGKWMVTLVFGYENPELISQYIGALQQQLPDVTSWIYIINTKHNDSMDSLEYEIFAGPDYFMESMEHLQFSVSPLSFYQVNVPQALEMYRTVRRMANLQGTETVYDLYTGTGTIALFLAPTAGKVVGIEYVPQAIVNAKENAIGNQIKNAAFYCGDIAKTLNDTFFAQNGRPDIIVSDPPRSGMHPEVIQQILNTEPEKLIYVSCNPATQARDIALLKEKYQVVEIQPFDMFPQTFHVENIALLVRK